MDRPQKSKRKKRKLLATLTIAPAALARYALIGGTSALIAFASFANALGGVTKVSHPAVALGFDGNQPTALTALADESLLKADEPAARKNATLFAKEAVRAAPLSAAAVRILGLAAADVKKPLAEKPLLELSRKLSRRDLGAHLWWIEYYVGNGNAKEALQSYDLALRTSIPARSILLPILYSALENPQIQSELVPYLQEQRAWVPELIIYATRKGHSSARLVGPLIASRSYPRSIEFARLARQTMENLLDVGDVVGVERIYAALPNADRRLLVQAKFSKQAADEQFIPIAWDLNGSSTAGAQLEASGDEGRPQYRLRAFAGSGESGTVARKLLFLKPGRYQLASTASVTLAAPQQEAKWVLSCTANSGAAPLVTHALLANQRPTSATSGFEVPAGCPAQLLQLQVAAEGGLSGTEVLVNAVDVKRM